MKRLIDIAIVGAMLCVGAIAGESLQWEKTTSTTNSTVTFTIPSDFQDNWYKLSNVQFEHTTAGAWAITVKTVTGGDRTNNVFSGTASTNSVGALWLPDGDLWIRTIEDTTNTQIVVTSGGTNFAATIQLAK